MPDSDVWTDLANEAQRASACAQTMCYIDVRELGWYTEFVHLGSHEHVCQVCPPQWSTVYTISQQTMRETSHAVLVGRLSRLLNHLHQDQPSAGLAGSDAPDAASHGSRAVAGYGSVGGTDPGLLAA